MLLNVSGSTRRFIDGSTFLGSLSVADLFEGLVALLESLVDSLLLEGDLTGLLKVLFADFLLGGSELCDISVMTFLNVLVGTFQDGVLLDGLDGLLLFNTAQTGLGVIHTTSEVNSSLDLGSSLGGLLTTLAPAASAATTVAATTADEVSAGNGQQSQSNKGNLKKSFFTLLTKSLNRDYTVLFLTKFSKIRCPTAICCLPG